MRRTAIVSIFFAASVPLTGSPLSGQGWSLHLNGGRVAYDLATRTLGEHGAILGLRYQQPDSHWLYLSSGIPFGSNDSPWGAAGLGTRLIRPVGSIDLGADLDARGYLYRDPALAEIGGGGVLEARPLIGIRGRSLRLEARSGWVQYESGIATASFSRGVHDSDLNLQLSLGRLARLSGTVRHVRAKEDDYSFGGGRLTLGSDRLGVWGSIGGWASDALPTTEWGRGHSSGWTKRAPPG